MINDIFLPSFTPNFVQVNKNRKFGSNNWYY